MLACVKHGHKGRDLGKAVHMFDKWDFKFDVRSSPASLFTVWESKINLHLHETTIPSTDMRKSFSNHPAYMSSLYLQIRQWAQEKETYEVQCRLTELESKNSCQEFMAYTLEAAYSELTKRFGKFN